MYLNYLYFNVYKWTRTRKIIGEMLTNTIVIQLAGAWGTINSNLNFAEKSRTCL